MNKEIAGEQRLFYRDAFAVANCLDLLNRSVTRKTLIAKVFFRPRFLAGFALHYLPFGRSSLISWHPLLLPGNR